MQPMLASCAALQRIFVQLGVPQNRVFVHEKSLKLGYKNWLVSSKRGNIAWFVGTLEFQAKNCNPVEEIKS